MLYEVITAAARRQRAGIDRKLSSRHAGENGTRAGRAAGAQSQARDRARITSYNVCYTKLLRAGHQRGARLEPQITGHQMGIVGRDIRRIRSDHVKALPGHGREPVAPHDAEIARAMARRITSYNVCYTKLLRSLARFRSPSSPMRAVWP